MARHVLVVDDDAGILASLTTTLERAGYRVSTAKSHASALSTAEGDPPDVVLLDLFLGDENGLAVLDALQSALDPAPPVIMISGAGGVRDAVAALKRGALDFVEKPLVGEDVCHRIERALKDRELERRVRVLDEAAGGAARLLGDSAAVTRVKDTIALVADTDASVLIRGESGTGKELVARAIHEHSARASAPFITVNCSAIPRELVESEFFGHQKGAFTGALTTRRGCFEAAQSGTLFLDEIGDMPVSAQPKLLRVLEARTVTRVGATAAIPVDVRVIAATHQDLSAAISAQTFRADLFHRLNVVDILLPPLRERPGDIPLLATHFLEHYAAHHHRPLPTLAGDALAALSALPFPGNVRELRNLIERIVILERGDTVSAAAVRRLAGDGSAAPTAPALLSGDAALKRTLKDVERQLIEAAIEASGGNMTDAAERLGLERSHLYRKVKELGIDRHD